jgi:hypothetical protein
MLILDTDHLTIIQRQSEPAYSRLATRLREFSSSEICTTIVNFEEQMRGWLAVIGRSRGNIILPEHVRGYAFLSKEVLRLLVPFHIH